MPRFAVAIFGLLIAVAALGVAMWWMNVTGAARLEHGTVRVVPASGPAQSWRSGHRRLQAGDRLEAQDVVVLAWPQGGGVTLAPESVILWNGGLQVLAGEVQTATNIACALGLPYGHLTATGAVQVSVHGAEVVATFASPGAVEHVLGERVAVVAGERILITATDLRRRLPPRPGWDGAWGVDGETPGWAPPESGVVRGELVDPATCAAGEPGNHGALRAVADGADVVPAIAWHAGLGALASARRLHLRCWLANAGPLVITIALDAGAPLATVLAVPGGWSEHAIDLNGLAEDRPLAPGDRLTSLRFAVVAADATLLVDDLRAAP